MLMKFHEEITKIVRVMAPEMIFAGGRGGGGAQITHKPRKLETSFFFVTYFLDKANIFAMFHELSYAVPELWRRT